MATDITNVYPSFSMFVFPFHPVVLCADFDRLMDNSTRDRASCVSKKKRRDKNAAIYNLSSCKHRENRWFARFARQTSTLEIRINENDNLSESAEKKNLHRKYIYNERINNFCFSLKLEGRV